MRDYVVAGDLRVRCEWCGALVSVDEYNSEHGSVPCTEETND